MLAQGHIVQGRYRVQRILGEGGMGSVYLAQDTRLPREWALKEMSDSFQDADERQAAEESFLAEAQILAALNHPNLPRIVDFFQEQGKHYLVMDFIAGTTLEKRLQQGPLSVSESLRIGIQVAQVLEYLHQQPQPVIFRDLKPANVILNPEGRPMLVDFGIARLFRQGAGKDTRALGTPGYAAPEQYGRGQSDHRTDLYALGATLHHCLSGVDPADHPFQFESLATGRNDMPPELDRVILRAVSLKPEDRFQNATDVRQALEGVERELSRSGVLPSSPKTAELTSQAQQPPINPAPAPTAAGFWPLQVNLGGLEWGQQARASVVLKGPVKGKLSSDSRWLRPVPSKVSGQDVTVTLYADTRALDEGGHVAGLIQLHGKPAISPLRVEAQVSARRTPAWCWPSAIFLLMWSLIPVVGLATTPLMFYTASQAPRRSRNGLSFLAWTSTFVSLSWATLLGIAVGLYHIDWKSWLHTLGF